MRRKVLPTDTDAGAKTTFSSLIRILALEDIETESSSARENDRSPWTVDSQVSRSSHLVVIHTRTYSTSGQHPRTRGCVKISLTASASEHNKVAGLATTEKNNVAQPCLTFEKREKQCCANDLATFRPRCHRSTRSRVSRWCRRYRKKPPQTSCPTQQHPPRESLLQNGKEMLPRQPVPWSPAHESKRSRARS